MPPLVTQQQSIAPSIGSIIVVVVVVVVVVVAVAVVLTLTTVYLARDRTCLTCSRLVCRWTK